MQYEYQNAKGERRSVVAPVKDRPPETIWMREDGSWTALRSPDADVPAGAGDGERFTRVYSTGSGYVNRFSAWRSPVTGKGLDGALDKGYHGL